MTTKEYIDGLRRLADFYEQHPMLDIPYNGGSEPFTVYSADSTKTGALAIAAMLGKCKKIFIGGCFFLVKEFGEVTLRFYFARDQICEKIVVGMKVIPAQSYPEHTEEVVEWKCHPLLSDETLG